MNRSYKKIVLVVLDGFGVATYSHGNAIALANPESLNNMIAHYPALTLLASGPVVGLPWGEMGNSEVGHLNMGAGRIVGQDLPRINQAILNRSFFSNQVFLEAISHARQNQGKLHIIGILGTGGVHGSSEHIFALLGLAGEQKFSEVYLHLITDGRDTGPKDAIEELDKLQAKISQIGVGKIATITGRFYAMDRGGHWNQTLATWRALVEGVGASADSAMDAILNNYNQGVFDEMIPPTVIVSREERDQIKPVVKVSSGDSVIFSNFRSDRALQLTQAFTKPSMVKSTTQPEILENLYFVTMTEYFEDLPVKVAFPPVNLHNNLAQVLSQHQYQQYHIAETEKYAHVTSFFNGGADQPFPGEERKIIQSPENENNYVDRPEMSGLEITDNLVEKIKQGQHNFYLANFANGDMVGHTGNIEAAIKAIKFLDRFLEQIMRAVLEMDGLLIITADHGNCEEMIDRTTGDINKEHTTSPVPLIVIAKDLAFSQSKRRNYLSLSSLVPCGVVSDIAPTILDFFGLPKPKEMTGISLRSQILGQLE